MCLYKVSRNIKAKVLVSELLNLEKKLQVKGFLWKDMRSKKQVYSHFWCHGSLGIMYSRLLWKKLRIADKTLIREEDINQLLKKYMEHIVQGNLDTQNYSLCHGNFAFVDFLISYEKLLGTSQSLNEYVKKIKENGEKCGYSCIGAPGAINSIGFMVGEAGIQYSKNRIDNYGNSSVLALEVI